MVRSQWFVHNGPIPQIESKVRMFRIRKILDNASNANRQAIYQVQDIIRKQFPTARQEDLQKLPLQLLDPVKYQYRSILFVVDNHIGRVNAFAMLLHLSDIGVTYLELISSSPQASGRGFGSILYERIRDESIKLRAKGLFFECSIDDERVTNPATLKQNQQRMRFYERFGALPIMGTCYDTPINPGDDDLYFLMYDPLDNAGPLPRKMTGNVVRAVLERKYGSVMSPSLITEVVQSFQDDPVRLRPPRYKAKPFVPKSYDTPAIGLVVNDRHAIHHVSDKGYLEAPIRLPLILDHISETGLFHRVEARLAPPKLLKRIHDAEYITFLQEVCNKLPANQSIYPTVFPGRKRYRPSRDIEVQIGCFCTDTMTPLNGNAYLAAKAAVDCAVTAAELLLEDFSLAYALVRPPGHHAEWNKFGGFCYFNSTAAAAEYLSDYGRVAIFDIDFHHGNGTQDIFYERSDVFTCSIHGDPAFAYPYFSGFSDETGLGEGKGANYNIPMPKDTTVAQYQNAMRKAIQRIHKFSPDFLVVALGLDVAKSDPTGTWSLTAKDFHTNGQSIGALHLPTLIVQEGGYRTRTLGLNARSFFEGLHQGHYGP